MSDRSYPINFARAVRQHPPDALPVPFVRRLGQADDVVPPSVKPKRQPQAAAEFAAVWQPSPTAAVCGGARWQGQKTAAAWTNLAGQSERVSGCLNVQTVPFARLRREYAAAFAPPAKLTACARALSPALPSVRACTAAAWRTFERLQGCAALRLSASAKVRGCLNSQTAPARPLALCQNGRQRGAAVSGCLNTKTGIGVQPPCEWHNIILPDPPPPVRRPCGQRPPSNRLPLAFKRRRTADSPDSIPLPFACKSDFARIPARKHYIMLNQISASFDGRPLDLLSVEIRTDTGGYCWQATLTLPPEEFAKLGLPKTPPPALDITVNGDTWRVLAEQYGDQRRFGRKSYTVTGRSSTAQLGADYAPVNKGMVASALYARQIADRQLANTGFKLANWAAVDWLVPENVYSLADKTPMGVIADIAAAAGAFVESHPHLPQIAVKPLWPTAAWQVNQAAPDVSVPVSAVLEVSGSLRLSAAAKGAFAAATHDRGVLANVRREGSNGEPRLPAVISHALYTESKVCRAAALAALSATGKHKTETVKLPLMPKYGLHRAELGQIWRFEETDGAWQGVVTGITVSVQMKNDAPVVYQTLTIDRYLGD